jgi:hypothetical protein
MTNIAPDLTPFVVAFVVLDVVAALLVIGLVAGALVQHHGRRVRRHESIRRYYGNLAFGGLAHSH